MEKSYYSEGGKWGLFKRLSMNNPSLTLRTSPLQKLTERCHPKENRPLQILNYVRIQTILDDCKFSGSTTSIYKQINNAILVKLTKALAKEIKNVLS